MSMRSPNANPTEPRSAMEWRIRGYDSLTETLSQDVPQEKMNPAHVSDLLKLLAARHLTARQILDAALGENELLEVRTDTVAGERLNLMAGGNPRYVAGLFRVDEAA